MPRKQHGRGTHLTEKELNTNLKGNERTQLNPNPSSTSRAMVQQTIMFKKVSFKIHKGVGSTENGVE